MLHVMIDGAIVTHPRIGNDANGKSSTLVQVRAEARDGKTFVASAIAYNRVAAAALAALSVGDAVTIVGRASFGRYEEASGLSVTVSRVLSLDDAMLPRDASRRPHDPVRGQRSAVEGALHG